MAFMGIKHALTHAPVLALPDCSKDFKIISDASDFGVGAVLLQEGRAVAFFSKKLNPAESNYHTTEKELAAVVYALREWRCYVLGRKVTVVSDHKANSYLQSQSFLHQEELGGQSSCKTSTLSGYGNPASLTLLIPYRDVLTFWQ